MQTNDTALQASKLHIHTSSVQKWKETLYQATRLPGYATKVDEGDMHVLLNIMPGYASEVDEGDMHVLLNIMPGYASEVDEGDMHVLLNIMPGYASEVDEGDMHVLLNSMPGYATKVHEGDLHVLLNIMQTFDVSKSEDRGFVWIRDCTIHRHNTGRQEVRDRD